MTSPNEPHVLYRLFNSDGALLYIGITNDPQMRWKQHGKVKPWWREVASISLQHFDSREAAEAAEVSAIKAEKPEWNIRHNGKPNTKRSIEPIPAPAPDASETWISMKQAMQILAPLEISVGTLRNYTDRGLITSIRLGADGKSGHRRLGLRSVHAALRMLAPDLVEDA